VGFSGVAGPLLIVPSYRVPGFNLRHLNSEEQPPEFSRY
jgi:hypothetical protein